MKVARTRLQREIMGIVLAAADQGNFLTVGEVRAILAEPPKKSAMSCRLTFLEKSGMIVRQYNGQRREIRPTPEGYAWFRA